MAVKKRGLGRGLDALLGSATEIDGEDALRELPLEALTAGPHQPRRHFDEDALEALAASIRTQGVVQPIVVRPVGANRYEIVAGERRWRAAQRAGLKRIPAVIRSIDANTAMAVALVENIQRADLNPLEEAEALQRLIDDCGLTHEQTAQAVGRSRAAVSNLLRLMELHADVQALVRDNRLSLGHAKVLMGAPLERQAGLAQRVVALGLSVRQTEGLLKGVLGGAPPQTRPDDSLLSGYERDLRKHLGATVRIQSGKGDGGKLVIAFKDRSALQRLIEKMKGT